MSRRIARVVQIFGGNSVKNVMTYKGYMARIEFDPRDSIFFGKVMGIEDTASLSMEIP